MSDKDITRLTDSVFTGKQIQNNSKNNLYFKELNQNQKKAVETLDGPLLVLSGAGTGKTRVLTARIANLLFSSKAKPWNILAVTFTNKAAKEMRERLENLIGPSVNNIWLGTFHSTAARILRENAELVSLKSNFTIINTDDQKRLLKELIIFEKLDEKKITPQFVLHLINTWKDMGLTVNDILNSEKQYLIDGKAGELFKNYQQRLLDMNYVDFADLLLHNLNIFNSHQDVLDKLKIKIKYFLIDEYQDTNTAQYLWLKMLVKPENNICCVGDDDQSIYGWRGADVRNILNFEKDFNDAKILRLEENYRSSKYILSAANTLIANNKYRLGKSLKTSIETGEKINIVQAWDGLDEARKISTKIETLIKQGVNFDEIAVLVRAGYQTRLFEERFVHIGLPYKVVGVKFYERLEIRDALAYFRLLIQKSDDLAFERIINSPKRGIGPQTINFIKNYSRDKSKSLFNSIKDLVQTDEFRPGVKLTLKNFIKNYDIWEDDLTKISHVDLAMKILEESSYIQSLKVEKSLESEGRLENLKELVNAMSAFDNMIGFLEHIALVNDSDAEHKDGQISLMTLHAAKGLEFSAVFLPCWEEGSFPSQRSIDEKGKEGLEEERRLAYVGITRAKKHLCISCASSRQIYGNWQNVIPSRFIEELPEKEIIGADFNVINNTSPHFEDYEFNQDYNNNEKFRNIINSGSSYNQINDQYRLDEDYSSNFKIGEKVFHIKFGTGSIIDIDEDKFEVNFDKAGIKKVIGSYLKNKF